MLLTEISYPVRKRDHDHYRSSGFCWRRLKISSTDRYRGSALRCRFDTVNVRVILHDSVPIELSIQQRSLPSKDTRVWSVVNQHRNSVSNRCRMIGPNLQRSGMKIVPDVTNGYPSHICTDSLPISLTDRWSVVIFSPRQ